MISISPCVYPVFAQDEKVESTQIKLERDPEGKDVGGSEEAAPLKADADEGSSTALAGAEGAKPEDDDEQERKDNSG